MHSSFVKLLGGNVAGLFNGFFPSLPAPVGVREMQLTIKYESQSTSSMSFIYDGINGFISHSFHANNFLHSCCSNKRCVFGLFSGLVILYSLPRPCVCVDTYLARECASVCELACVTNSAPKQFTVPEGHIYVARSQFTS